jgi:hypothetical protein
MQAPTPEQTKPPQPQPSLEELFSLLETREDINLEHFFDRVMPSDEVKP